MRKAENFHSYFNEHLFNQVEHGTEKDLGDKTILLSPEMLKQSKSEHDFGTKSGARSGDRDEMIGNTRYVFCSYRDLPGPSSHGSFKYKAGATRADVVPRDIADLVPLTENNLEDDYPLRIHDYARNIFTNQDFEVYFSQYCAALFDSPEQAMSMIRSLSWPTLNINSWGEDQRNLSAEQIKVVNEMKILYRRYGLIPPISPEIQFRDQVPATKVVDDQA